jgi:hypothetical protein
MITYYRTRLGAVVTVDAPADHEGYRAVRSVLTGRELGRLRFSALTPATEDEIQRAEAECLELANSPEPPHDCEMARARLGARRRLGMMP